ncbi:hypothetical protein S780_24890 [Salmonella enterica]|nr:hypothetical protein [Salmonella enterica subsp. enterica serovar Aschersleben]EEJ7264187.1 hypothetical protein [Salmonella enterica subsp. enterica]MID14144.1 hypothetical protein [Salmonella enterica]
MITMNSSREKGLTLIESAMVLALSAVVIAGVLAYYNYAAENNKMRNSIEELQHINATVQALYSHSHIPPHADEVAFAKAVALAGYLDLLPVAGVPKIKFPVGGYLELWGLSGHEYQAEIQGFSASECVRFATLNFGTAMVTSPELLDGNGTPEPTNFSMKTANALCNKVVKAQGDGNPAKLRFTFRV